MERKKGKKIQTDKQTDKQRETGRRRGTGKGIDRQVCSNNIFEIYR